MGSLDGKVALITGAASKRGMGHAIALRLAGEGADVVVFDKNPTPKSLFSGDEGWGGLDAVVAEIKSLGKKALAVVVDVSHGQEVAAAVAKILKELGRIDILVHCAAIRGPVGTPAIELDEKDWRAVVDVDLTATFLISKAVAKSMVARGEGGRIVILASLAGTHGVAGSAAYSAAKYGVIGLTKSLALELAKYKINVNAINPGMIITNLRDEAFAEMAEAQGITLDEARERDYQKVSTSIPMGRLGTPEEVADLAFFLVSDLSTYITGETIGISGGAT
jgi:NAD(P)-dependent dehydrogenase (short-subunit alcohol dehydrogenase family)